MSTSAKDTSSSGAVTLSPMMIQYNQIKDQYPNEVVFFRLGDFYEMFNKDAVDVSRLLNLTLTHRAQQPMCGIPYHAAKIYIARLLRLGKKIVICEQIGDPKAKGLTERKVVEIITPGTAVESEYLEGNRANFLAALSITKGKAGFAFIDVTTSSFEATSWPSSRMAENFAKELGRAGPRELLLPQSLKNNDVIQEALESFADLSVSYYPDWDFNSDFSFRKLNQQFNTANLHGFGLEEDSPEVAPAGFLLDYLEKTTNSKVPHVSGIRIFHDDDFLVMDDSSRRNLEITENLRDGTYQYSLMECVNHTKTAMGSRLLRNWLLFPLTDVARINDRLDRVQSFYDNQTLLDDVRETLSPVLDIERLAGRIAMDRAHGKDLQALRLSLESWIQVRSKLLAFDFSFLESEPAEKVIELISSSILEDPATSLTEGRIIKEGWSEELDQWRGIRDNFNNILASYEEEEREASGISTLKIKYNNASGYFIEISKGKLDGVPQHFIRRRSLMNGDRFTTEKLQALEQQLNESGSKILELERDLFLQVRNALKEFVPYLLQLSGEIAHTDVTSTFAYSSRLHSWVRPVVDESGIFDIKNGRHPVVELHLPTGEFVPNDSVLGYSVDGVPSFNLITGPNMAGKSTYLRQNALIALLAQSGCYVPAEQAHIGIIDKIFCRVGASDNLARGESTFLVEMTETANILVSSTEKSLVIMDEVGRGTSTEDGLSIARAVSEYLLDTIKCRTFFATHYHELSRMEHPAIRMLCMDVKENAGSVVFLRKIKEGASGNSYGIHVARLAGIPDSVIQRAKAVLAHIQSVNSDKPVIGEIENIPAPVKEPETPVFTTPGLFNDEEIILDEILSCDTDNMTPMAALQAVSRWKKTLAGR
ncbi:MAG: DNA mismatch repair protein MutS [Treponema sp.]|nr:DNA mismatch repair protein MutS [Treponema sp.]